MPHCKAIEFIFWGCKYSIIKIPLQAIAPKFFMKFPNLSPFKSQIVSVFL
jgi:hypothetical protein